MANVHTEDSFGLYSILNNLFLYNKEELMQNILKTNSLSRRLFMQKSAAAFLGVTAINGFATENDMQVAQRKGSAKHIIYLYMSGGMSHLDTFDLKPGHKNQGSTRAIKTNVDGIQISEYLPKLSKHVDKMTIINSLTSTAGAHEQAKYLMHTSYEQRATIKHPGIGAWLNKYHGRLNKNLPGSVFIGGDSRIDGGGGFFEPEFEPLSINNPTSGLKNSRRRMSEKEFEHRLTMSEKLDKKFHEKYDVKQVRAYSQMYKDATRIMSSKDLEVFNLNNESQKVKNSYGSDLFGQGCLLARRLVEHDVRSIEVSLGGWDTHQNNFVSVQERCAILDQAMAALLNDLQRVGKLKDTLVVLTTEFGRTPKINQNSGRDHYPKAFSSVIAGGPAKGGTIYGKTSEGGEEVIDKPMKIQDFNATIAYGLGMPVEATLFSPSKRPFKVAHKGKPVKELFS
jgi:hypothetical protein